MESELDGVQSRRSQLLSGDPAYKAEDYVQRAKVDGEGYVSLAKRLRMTNNILQVVVILGALLAATLAGLSGENPTARWIAVVSGAMASLAASLASYFKFRERSISLEQAGNGISAEIDAFNLRAGRYRQIEEEMDRKAELVEGIGRIQSEMRQREAALGNDMSK
jgi:hypothetical protein